MNWGVPLAAGGAVVAGQRRKVVRRFREAGATAPDAALGLEQLGLRKTPILRLLCHRGVLVEARRERYFLDTRREAEVARFRRRLVLAVLSLLGLVFAVSFYSGSGQP